MFKKTRLRIFELQKRLWIESDKGRVRGEKKPPHPWDEMTQGREKIWAGQARNYGTKRTTLADKHGRVLRFRYELISGGLE